MGKYDYVCSFADGTCSETVFGTDANDAAVNFATYHYSRKFERRYDVIVTAPDGTVTSYDVVCSFTAYRRWT